MSAKQAQQLQGSPLQKEHNMSERITNDDVRAAFDSLKEAATEAGVNGAEDWNLYFGQNTAEGYTCYIVNRTGTRTLSDNLGSSKREASAAMRHMADGINLALNPNPAPARRGRPRKQVAEAV
jgi:hypothetical protein